MALTLPDINAMAIAGPKQSEDPLLEQPFFASLLGTGSLAWAPFTTESAPSTDPALQTRLKHHMLSRDRSKVPLVRGTFNSQSPAPLVVFQGLLVLRAEGGVQISPYGHSCIVEAPCTEGASSKLFGPGVIGLPGAVGEKVIHVMTVRSMNGGVHGDRTCAICLDTSTRRKGLKPVRTLQAPLPEPSFCH